VDLDRHLVHAISTVTSEKAMPSHTAQSFHYDFLFNRPAFNNDADMVHFGAGPPMLRVKNRMARLMNPLARVRKVSAGFSNNAIDRSLAGANVFVSCP
jgi:hypothetical protein